MRGVTRNKVTEDAAHGNLSAKAIFAKVWRSLQSHRSKDPTYFAPRSSRKNPPRRYPAMKENES